MSPKKLEVVMLGPDGEPMHAESAKATQALRSGIEIAGHLLSSITDNINDDEEMQLLVHAIVEYLMGVKTSVAQSRQSVLPPNVFMLEQMTCGAISKAMRVFVGEQVKEIDERISDAVRELKAKKAMMSDADDAELPPVKFTDGEWEIDS